MSKVRYPACYMLLIIGLSACNQIDHKVRQLTADYVVHDICAEVKRYNKQELPNEVKQALIKKYSSHNINTKQFVRFEKTTVNVIANRCENLQIDTLDKKLLPQVLDRDGFQYVEVDGNFYVHKELMENQDFVSKTLSRLETAREFK